MLRGCPSALEAGVSHDQLMPLHHELTVLRAQAAVRCRSASTAVAQLHRAAAEPAVPPTTTCFTKNAVYAADLHHLLL